jgi:hypothetical protein
MTEPRTRRCRPFRAEEIAIMCAMAEQGHGCRRIATFLGRPQNSVQSWLARHGHLEAREVKRLLVTELLAAEPGISNREVARRLSTSAYLVARVRGRTYYPILHASPVEWLEQPPGRIVAQRAAHGITSP